MTTTLSANQQTTLVAALEKRRRVVRADLATKLNTQENPALLGLRNRMEETDDWAVADLEAALDVAEVSREASELSEIEAALARVTAGRYGECIECAAAIPYARLYVAPSAARCIACQSRLEAATRRGPATL